MSNTFKLIIGLGNPGPEYADTYHSVGLLFLDYLEANRQNSKFEIRNSKFLKSNAFMNESGAYVRKAMKKYGAKLEEILIAHDESDLALGTFKLSFDRSSAGHKGVRSIIDILGTKKFWRLRIGTRAPSKGRMKALEFALKKISKDDKEKLLAVFEKITNELSSSFTGRT